MSKNIGYHTRLISDNTVKICGGSFGGVLDMETTNRLVKSQFTVQVKQSGRAVFVDRNGREVSLYISVDASNTDAGIAAMFKWKEEKRIREEQEEEFNRQKQEQIEEAMRGMTFEEIMTRLKG
jgi:hypothetical protein